MTRHPHHKSFQRTHGRVNTGRRARSLALIVLAFVACAVPLVLTEVPGVTTAAQAPAPVRTTGGLTFAPATVVDMQRTEGEPINHVDKDGNYWESGPWGFSTNQSFVHRSTDGGNQFNIVSPNGLRPNSPPGGGDSDIITDDQGNAYFTDLEGAFDELDCSVTNDGGNTWRKNPGCVQAVGVDRQWFAIDNGTNHTAGAAGAADNTIFLTTRQVPTTLSHITSSPGSTGSTDPIGGLVFTPAATIGPSPGAPCGQLRFDSVNRNLYLPCVSNSGQVTIARAHVNVGQRTGLAFTTVTVTSSSNAGNLFPIVTIDQAGTVYAVWANTSNRNIYYAYSTNQGTNWSAAIQVNSAPASTNVFPWAIAGSGGRLVVAWYGTSTVGDPSSFASWYADGPAADNVKWFGYVALITDANTLTPTIDQNLFTHKPQNYGQVCLAGTLCTTTPNSDRTMADYMAITLDLQGRIRVIFNDTTSQHHGAHLFEARQISGPTALGTTISEPVPASPMADPTGDAKAPHYAPSPLSPGANLPHLDFTQVKVSQSGPNSLQVQMTLNNLNTFAPPVGKTNAFWITRFQALSVGDRGEESYRIFYVGAESLNGAAPTFFVGSGTAASPQGVPGNGCLTTTAQNCKVVQYPAEATVTGKIVGNTLCINAPFSSFGANRPIATDATLYNVTAFSGGRNNTPEDVYTDADATRSFDYTLGTINGLDCNAINVALSANGSTATASSEYPNGGFPATSAIDGEHKGLNWGANGGWNDGTRDVYPDWLQVDFNGSKIINQIIVYTVQNNFHNPQEPTPLTPADYHGLLDFDVQYWDGSNWVTVPGGSVVGNDKAMRTFLFAPVTTTKIRVFVTDARVHYSRITEVEAFGVAAP
jgi:hypothetical protein